MKKITKQRRYSYTGCEEKKRERENFLFQIRGRKHKKNEEGYGMAQHKWMAKNLKARYQKS